MIIFSESQMESISLSGAHFPLKTILQSNRIHTLSFLYNNPFVYWKSAHSGLAEWEDINIWTPLPVSNSTRPQLFF